MKNLVVVCTEGKGQSLGLTVCRCTRLVCRVIVDWAFFLSNCMCPCQFHSLTAKDSERVHVGTPGTESSFLCLFRRVSDSSGSFPHGFCSPVSSSPSNPRSRAEYPSGSCQASLDLCSTSSCPVECAYTVAPPLVLLAVILQTLHVLNLRLTSSDQQSITSLLLELRSAAALNEIMHGRAGNQPSAGSVPGGPRCEGFQQAHRQALRQILLLLPGVAGESGKLVRVLQKQIAKTKNKK